MKDLIEWIKELINEKYKVLAGGGAVGSLIGGGLFLTDSTGVLQISYLAIWAPVLIVFGTVWVSVLKVFGTICMSAASALAAVIAADAYKLVKKKKFFLPNIKNFIKPKNKNNGSDKEERA